MYTAPLRPAITNAYRPPYLFSIQPILVFQLVDELIEKRNGI